MENSYNFWQKYLIKIKNKIIEMCANQEKFYVDFHIHSNYSSDGKQTIDEILNTTKAKGFNLISITDHDSLKAYDDIYELVKNGLTDPIIIPGIEFTIDNSEYRNQCHILQMFINPKDSNLIKNVKINYKASFNRSIIQFNRISENVALQKIINEKNINLSYLDYKKYLEKNNLLPEYGTLGKYLSQKLKNKRISNFQILDKLEEYNNYDCFEDRKNLKNIKFKKLREKYNCSDDDSFNSRFLLSMLAIREVDDDWWPSPSSGSLSVNSYGQLKLNELNTKFMTFWAHPTESKLDVVNKNIKLYRNIIGLEKNIRNQYNDLNNFYNILSTNNLFEIIGSDSHDSTCIYYEDMSFFEMDSKKLKMLVMEFVNQKKL